MAKGFFKTENISAAKTRIHINGVVGDWGNTSQDVIWQTENIEASEIEVIIQSPGGSAFEGIAIHNALVNHPATVTTRILGAAASAASIIFMAGQNRIMPRNTYLMIHEPSIRINGRAKDLREAADFLEGILQALVATYLPPLSISSEKLLEMIMAESWINADDALGMGFATQVEDPVAAVALSSEFYNRFTTLPDALTRGSVADTVANINNERDLEACLRESSGFSNGQATALVSRFKAVLRGEPAGQQMEIYNLLKNFKIT